MQKEFFFPLPITSMTSLNASSIIALSQGDSATIINFQLSKTVSHFYASPTPIMNLFSYHIANLLITDSSDGVINFWDTGKLSKIPTNSSFLLNEEPVISSDYNSDSSLYYALDAQGKAYLNSVKSYCDDIFEGNVWEEYKEKPIFIKGDRVNFNQFVVGYEKGIKYFDIRNFKCVKELNNGNNVMNIVNDSKEVLIIEKNNIELWNLNMNESSNEGGLLQKWTQFNNIVHSNFNIFYHNNEKNSMIILGMYNGDVYYSSLTN